MAVKTEKTFASSDGKTTIHARCWAPDAGTPLAVLQISHGMVEYVDRYDAFARYMAEQGFLVVGHDHLGHGASVTSPDSWGYFTEGDGSHILVEDLHTLRTLVQQEYPGLPYLMLGHSMGSFILRRYLMEHGEGLTAAVISGTGYKPEALANVFLAVCRVIAALRGWGCHSRVAKELFFSGAFHKFDMDGSRPEDSWLTNDAEIVRRYYAEPRCTFPFTVSGFYTITRLVKADQKPANIARTPKDLPLLFVSGDQDPVGDFGAGVRKVCKLYRKAGQQKVKMLLYPGARHEVLNEVKRNEFWKDILDWCREQL